jgi:hypothetical protein
MLRRESDAAIASDADGEQLKAIKAYLEAHPDIEWVWYAYSSMPQKREDGIDDRTPEEKAEYTADACRHRRLVPDRALPHSPRRVVRIQVLDDDGGVVLDADGHIRWASALNGG